MNAVENVRSEVNVGNNMFPASDRRTYTVSEIQDILGVSQPTAYSLIKQNLFRSIKVGRHIRISKKSFDEWLDSQM